MAIVLFCISCGVLSGIAGGVYIGGGGGGERIFALEQERKSECYELGG